MFGQEFADKRRPELNGIGRVYQKMAVLSKIGQQMIFDISACGPKRFRHPL
jgi:hypothetical protein